MKLWFLCGVFCLCQGSMVEQLSREELLSWFRHKVLDGLGLEEPPVGRRPIEERRYLGSGMPKRSRMDWVDQQDSKARQDASQVILFPSSETTWPKPDSQHLHSNLFSYVFQHSINPHQSVVTAAQLWFFSGLGLPANSSAPVFMITSGQQHLVASTGPSTRSWDGWSTYNLDQNALKSMGGGQFTLYVKCPKCKCFSELDKTPFLNLQVQSLSLKRKARSVSIPWSASVLDLLQRPSLEKHGDCHREHIEISFEELGWDNWIVHPKLLTFYYCHGNCSSPERTTARLGMIQCCAPVPGSMRSLRITTTSDGGYSFKYETLPNIIPEECACI